MTRTGVVHNDGIDLVVEQWGDAAAAPPLVLVHGFTGSRTDWIDVAPRLAATRRVVAHDNRGHGDSTNTGDAASYTFAALGDDLDRVIGEVADGPVDLLGHSMGGIVAMRYVLDHPDKVRSLVLMDTGAVPAGRIPTDFIDATLALARDKGMGAVADNFNTFLSSTITDEERLARGHKKVSSMDVEAFAAFATELNSYASMLEELATIACPALVLVGENDTGLRGSADAMAERIPGATLAVIAGAGHSPQEDDPDAWLAAVEAHLARVG